MIATIEEVSRFIEDNKTFFTDPLTNPDAFAGFYQESGNVEVISDYSSKLSKLLYEKQYRIDDEAIGNVIIPWREQNFAPALEHEAIRAFLMDNKDHPALQLWRNKKKQEDMLKQLETDATNAKISQLEQNWAGFTEKNYAPDLLSSIRNTITLHKQQLLQSRISLQQYQQAVTKALMNLDSVVATIEERVKQLEESEFEAIFSAIEKKRAALAERGIDPTNTRQGADTPLEIFKLLEVRNCKVDFINGKITLESLLKLAKQAKDRATVIWVGVEQRLAQIEDSEFIKDLALLEEQRNAILGKNPEARKVIEKLILDIKQHKDDYIAEGNTTNSMDFLMKEVRQAKEIFQIETDKCNIMEKRRLQLESSGFIKAIKALEDKSKELLPKHPIASKLLDKLILALSTQTKKYVAGDGNFKDFKNHCKQLIDAAKETELKNHRGVMRIFELILDTLARVFTAGYLRISFHTDSVRKAERVNFALDNADKQQLSTPGGC